NVFEPKCGIDVFETFRTSFDLEKDEYLDYINKINDPTLKYVSVYLVQYYKDGFNYFRNSEQTYRSEACNYLNKWLKEKHDLFTFGNNCAEKQKLWEKVIGKLWTDLTKDRRYFYQSTDSWCTDRNYIFQTTFPLKVIELNCDKSISQETRSAISPPLTIQTERNCPPCSCPVISQETGHPQETGNPPERGNPPETEQLSGTDRTKNLAVTSGFTAFGTLGTLLVLYKVIYKQ
ncbi:hypothetical protein PVBG_05695, partial [Plasmodium vivax Brazil I]